MHFQATGKRFAYRVLEMGNNADAQPMTLHCGAFGRQITQRCSEMLLCIDPRTVKAASSVPYTGIARPCGATVTNSQRIGCHRGALREGAGIYVAHARHFPVWGCVFVALHHDDGLGGEHPI
ncbi:hypothetical protein [Blastomonas sp.]|uniref:hypothetical protein n=1 Tax=Blastomonas sp. TaxID=1909299 RepID=UPI00391A10F0